MTVTQQVILRCAHAEAQYALLERLCRAGWAPEQLAGMTLGDLLPCPAKHPLTGYRWALRLPFGAGAPVAIDDDGHRLAAEDLELTMLAAARP